MKEKPTENRLFTGSDDPFTAEQVGNLLKSNEFNLVQEQRIKDVVSKSVTPQIAAARRKIQMFSAMELILPTRDGALLVGILKCRYVGYSHKKIAKILMKSEKDLPYFSSITKAVEFVKNAEKEGTYRVKIALTKKIIIP